MAIGLGDLALRSGKKSDEQKDDVVDIITFIEAPWGLGMRLFPVQRVILKAHYGLELDDNPLGVDITKPIPLDHPNYDEITAQVGREKGYYKNRVVVSDWRRTTFQVFTEAGYLRYLHASGRCNIKEVTPGVELRELVLAIGRRSGKTLLASCIAAYENYKLLSKGNPQAYYGLPEGDNVMITSVATDKDQAGLLYAGVSNHFRKCAFFRPFTANNTQSYARFQTPLDIERYGTYSDDPKTSKASIKVTFKSCIAKGLRGPGNIVIILDEIAHFTDAGQSSAEEVYKAITPSISAFTPKDPEDPTTAIGPGEGRIISISSPLGQEGKFYELFQQGMKGTRNFLCIEAPTWEVNPTVPEEEFEKHYLKDPRTFFIEFGAEFSPRGRGWIEDPKDLLDCVDPGLRPKFRAPARVPHFMGIDFALKGDATAIAIGHVNDQKRIVLDCVEQIKAGEGDYDTYDRLDFEEVADWIHGFSKRFFIAEGMFDTWSGIVFEQALHKRGLTQLKSVNLTRQESSKLWFNFKDLMWDQRVILYDWPLPEGQNHCPYIQELLELQEKRHSKHIITVSAPKVDGKHDDRPDALVRMCWLASKILGNNAYIASRRQGDPRAQGARSLSAKEYRKAYVKTRRGGSHPDRMPKGVRGKGRTGRTARGRW